MMASIGVFFLGETAKFRGRMDKSSNGRRRTWISAAVYLIYGTFEIISGSADEFEDPDYKFSKNSKRDELSADLKYFTRGKLSMIPLNKAFQTKREMTFFFVSLSCNLTFDVPGK